MIAVYISSNQFKVEEDRTEEFKIGRRIKANCGDDGYVYSTILSSSYSSSYTTITITESILTFNLIDVLYGIVNTGDTGSLPGHLHNGSEGQGGSIDYISINEFTTYSGVTQTQINTYSGILQTHINNKPDTFLELTDTPTMYDYGKYAISTSSGIIWGSAGSSNVQTFLDLTDTPITYTGHDGEFVKVVGNILEFSTISGSLDLSYSSNLFELDEDGGMMPVATISGISDVILVAPDNSRWRLVVSNIGVLSTEAF